MKSISVECEITGSTKTTSSARFVAADKSKGANTQPQAPKTTIQIIFDNSEAAKEFSPGKTYKLSIE